MAFVVPEMVQEVTNGAAEGTSTAYTLNGAVANFRAFSNELANNDTTLYTVFDTASPPVYEINYGTWSSGPNTLSRTTLVKSSTGAAINWGASIKNVVAGIPGKMMQGLLDPTQGLGLVELTAAGPAVFDTTPVSALSKTMLNRGSNILWRNDLDAQQDVISARGDIVRGSSAAVAERLAIGASERVLGSDGTDASWRRLLAAWMDYSSAVSPLSTGTIEAVLDQIGGYFAATIYRGATSGDVAIAASSTTTWAHGMATTPTMIAITLKCLTNDGTYTADDLVYIGSSMVAVSTSSVVGIGIRMDSTNVYIDKITNSIDTINIIQKGGGGNQTLDESDWAYNIRAYA